MKAEFMIKQHTSRVAALKYLSNNEYTQKDITLERDSLKNMFVKDFDNTPENPTYAIVDAAYTTYEITIPYTTTIDEALDIQRCVFELIANHGNRGMLRVEALQSLHRIIAYSIRFYEAGEV